MSGSNAEGVEQARAIRCRVGCEQPPNELASIWFTYVDKRNFETRVIETLLIRGLPKIHDYVNDYRHLKFLVLRPVSSTPIQGDA